MTKVADQLGYVESAQFYRYRNRYDGWIHAANYSLKLAFATPLTRSEVHSMLASAFYITDQRSVRSSDVAAFLIDGQSVWDDPFRNEVTYAHEWIIKNWYGAIASVTIVETASLDHFVTHREQLVRSNILMIDTYIGTVSHLAIPYHLLVRQPVDSPSEASITASVTTELLTHGSRQVYEPDTPITIMAALARGTQLVVADALTFTITAPDGSTIPITMRDRSATRYRMSEQSLWAVTSVAPAVAGRYQLQVIAEVGDQRFEHAESIYVVPPPDFVAGLQVIGETTVNKDKDDLAEVLELNLHLAVTTPGHYRVDGVLSGSPGVTRTISATGYLTTGVDIAMPYTGTVSLQFDSADLWTIGEEGAYKLTAVTVIGSTNISSVVGLVLPIPYQYNWVKQIPLDYVMARYPHKTFKPLPLSHTPPVDNVPRRVMATDETITDLNHDGLFDRLTISVTLDHAVTGDLVWRGALVDDEGLTIAETYTKSPVTATQTIPFVFAGSSVAALMQPTSLSFQLRYLQRSGSGERLLNGLPSLHRTATLQPARFARVSLLWAEEELIDRDQDGLFEALIIRLQPDLLYSGQYEFDIQVADHQSRSITGIKEQRLWSLADPIVITISGAQIINGKHVGPYQVSELRVTKQRDDNTFFRFTDIYHTQTYQLVQFEMAE